MALTWLLPCAGHAAGIHWQTPVEIARTGGEPGPWQQNDSRCRFVDDPSVAIVNSALKPGSHSRVWLLHGALR